MKMSLISSMSTKTRFEKEAKGSSEMAYCGAALEPNSFSALDTLIFRPGPKISLSPETHEYLEQVITLAEINFRQNKNLQNIKYTLTTNKYNVQSIVLQTTLFFSGATPYTIAIG